MHRKRILILPQPDMPYFMGGLTLSDEWMRRERKEAGVGMGREDEENTVVGVQNKFKKLSKK